MQNADPTYMLLYVDIHWLLQKIKTHIQTLKTQLKKGIRHERFGRSQEDLRYVDHSRQRLRQILTILGELHSQSVRKIQHGRSKTSHHFFGRLL